MKDRTLGSPKRAYTFTKDGQEYETSNLMAFCREHGLQRRHINEVVQGIRKSHHGFSYSAEDQKDVELETVLQAAEIAARSSGDADYEALVLRRTAKVRAGEPINIRQDKYGSITVLD